MARGSFLAAPAHSISVWYSSSRSFLTSVIQFQYSRPPPAYNEFLQMPFWFGVLPSPTAPLGWYIMYARQSLLLEDEKFDDLLSWNQFKPRRQSPDLLKYFTSHTLKLPQNVAGCPGGLEPGWRSQLSKEERLRVETGAALRPSGEIIPSARCVPNAPSAISFSEVCKFSCVRHSNSQNK